MSKSKITPKDSDFMNKLDRKQYNKKQRQESKKKINPYDLNEVGKELNNENINQTRLRRAIH
jgi:hypothetical protein